MILPMRKFILMLSMFVSFMSLEVFAQRDVDDQSDWKDRIYFGGGGGFSAGTNQIGSRYFSFTLTPVVGYMVTTQMSVGSGVVYQRTTFPDDFNYSFVQYGLMPFVRYNFNELFLTAEYNYINSPLLLRTASGFVVEDRMYTDRLLFGAGYSKPVGQRMRINAVAMYDVLYQRPSVFNSPWVFRVFFSF
jgi:hypothetical protein